MDQETNMLTRLWRLCPPLGLAVPLLLANGKTSSAADGGSLVSGEQHAALLHKSEIEQTLGVYTDNQERSRQRLGVRGDLAFDHYGLVSSTTYSVRGFRDRVHEMMRPRANDAAEGVSTEPILKQADAS